MKKLLVPMVLTAVISIAAVVACVVFLGWDLALMVGRCRAGMALRDLGREAGGMDYSTVSEAIRRIQKKSKTHSDIQKAYKRVLQMLNMETCPYSWCKLRKKVGQQWQTVFTK